MAVGFNSQQQKAIASYRQQHNLGYVISDEEIASRIKKEGGTGASVFSQSTQPTWNKVSQPQNNSSSIFGKSSSTQQTPSATSAKTSTTANTRQTTTASTQAPKQKETAEQTELKQLGLQNNEGSGTKVKLANGQEYTVVGTANNGRRIVKDSNGQLQVISHDNKVLKKDYVIQSNKDNAIRTDSKTAHTTTVDIMKDQLNNAQKAFDKQMEQDGWAGDLADGISVLWGSDNRASKVRKDLTTYNKNIEELQKAAQKGDAQFNAKFKQIYGKDYDQNAMADYVKNPTQKNYEKAFGTKNNIQDRVAKYNESQQTGAAAVKTGAKVAAGVAVGVATGGAGLVAVGVAAAGTAAASVAIEETDRMNLTKAVTEGKVEFREGTDHGQIFKDAAWDGASVLAGGAVAKATGTVIKGATKAAGVARAATNTAGDVAMGAAQEYTQTGEVSASGTIMNAALGSVGIAAETGALKKVKNLFTGKSSSADVSLSTKNTTNLDTPSAATDKTSTAQQVQTQTSENVRTNTPETGQTTKNQPVSDNSPAANTTNTDVTETVHSSNTSSSQSILDKYDNPEIKTLDLNKEELKNFDEEINKVFDKIFDNEYPNPKETIEKLENLVAKLPETTKNKKMYNSVLNSLRKQNGMEPKTPVVKTSTEVDTNSKPSNSAADVNTTAAKSEFDINTVYKSRDSDTVRKSKQEIYDLIKDKNLSNDDLHQILGPINEDNISLAKKIAQDTEISAEKANTILSWTDADNISLTEKLYYDTSISDDIAERILMNTNKNNAFFAEYLLDTKDFPNSSIGNAISTIRDADTANCTRKLLETQKFSTEEIVTISGSVNKYNISYAEDVILNRGLSKGDAATILGNVNAHNASYAQNIIYNKDLSFDEANGLLGSINSNNASFAEDIIFNRDLSTAQATKLLKSVNFDNVSLAQKVVSNPDFSADETTKLLGKVNSSNRQEIENLYNNYKELGILPKQIKEVAGNVCTVEKLQELNKKFGIETVSKWETNDYRLIDSFSQHTGKENISELSKTEKREILLNLLKNKSNIDSNNLKEIIPLIPTNSSEYEKLIKGITESLNIDVTPLTGTKLQTFNRNLDELSTSLKTMDLSELKQINLTMPHEEFTSKVQNLMKDLPAAEQAKVQDYFSFRIENGKLSGYPNTKAKDLSALGISDQKTIDTINKMKPTVDAYTNSNFVTTNDIPELNRILKNISEDMPELFNQIDGSSNPVDMIKSMQKIVKNPQFDNLSDGDKKVMLLSTLLHNTDKASGSAAESAFDAYFIAKKFNISDTEAQKLYKIVQTSDSIDKFMATQNRQTDRLFARKERKEFIDNLAFNLKEDNSFELAQMLYSSKETAGLTRNLDKAVNKRIQEMKAQDFALPQTSKETYLSNAAEQTIVRDGVSYNVKVVNSEDIDNFYAFIHTPEAGFATGGSRSANFANFEIFKDFADDKVICTSYVSNGKAGLVKEYHHGFVFDVANQHQYVGYNYDIYSMSKNIPDMLNEYFSNRGLTAKQNKGTKFEHRTMISDALKSNLTGEDYRTLANSFSAKKQSIDQKYHMHMNKMEYKRKALIQEKTGGKPISQSQYQELKKLPEIQEIENEVLNLKRLQQQEIESIAEYSKLQQIDNSYIEKLDKIKKQLGTETMTIENLEKIDPDFAKAYKQLLEAGENDGAYLLYGPHHNEVLVSNPKISALYTDDINNIPEEYLKKAQEENLPIVIIKT